MAGKHFVVDGSNLATEGRTEPSLAQLREAVAALRKEYPGVTITVVVDASFEHRIDDKERAAFGKAEAAGEIVSPPAGAIGRGDGFLLQIADRTGATVLSNDSFQEFHGEYGWLFDTGRLVGAKPVTRVGWIFSLRTPVRGARSHKAVREKEKTEKQPKTPKVVKTAIAEATADALEPTSPKARRRRSRGGRSRAKSPPPGAVNDPHPFLTFVIDHPLGSKVQARVDEFSSHGAFVSVDGVRCYVPLAAMGDPPPKSARAVFKRGETRTFVVQAVDAPRRGVELAVPGFAHPAGSPTEETVEAVTGGGRARRRKGRPSAASTAAAKRAPAKAAASEPAPPAKKVAKKRRKKVATNATEKVGQPSRSATKKSARMKATRSGTEPVGPARG
jgi:hypothetical protein